MHVSVVQVAPMQSGSPRSFLPKSEPPALILLLAVSSVRNLCAPLLGPSIRAVLFAAAPV